MDLLGSILLNLVGGVASLAGQGLYHSEPGTRHPFPYHARHPTQQFPSLRALARSTRRPHSAGPPQGPTRRWQRHARLDADAIPGHGQLRRGLGGRQYRSGILKSSEINSRVAPFHRPPRRPYRSGRNNLRRPCRLHPALAEQAKRLARDIALARGSAKTWRSTACLSPTRIMSERGTME
jgi:hypothetical protein